MAATAPVWKANGTAASGTGAVNVAWPIGHAAGDFAVLAVNSSNQAIATPSGWTRFGTNTGTGTGGSADSCMLALFYRFATSGAESNAALADSGDHTLGVITTFTGVSTVNPIEAISAYTTKSTSSTSDTFPAVTTLGANRLVVAAISTGQESVKSSPTFGGLSSFTARGVGTTTSGVDGGIALFSGGKAAAGSTGTGSVTESITSKAISVTFALTPVDFEKTVTCTGIASSEAFGSLTAPAGVSRAGEVSPGGISSSEVFGTAGIGFSYAITDCLGVGTYTGAGGAQTVNVLPAASRATMSIAICKDVKTESSRNPWIAIMGDDLSTSFQSLVGRDQTGFVSGSPTMWATSRGIQFSAATYMNTVDLLYKAYTFRVAPGFMDFVEYTGDGNPSKTISHDLGMVPAIMIVTPRDLANGTNWYHSGLGATKHLTNHDRADIVVSGSSNWASTAPTASQFTVGPANNTAGLLHRVILFGNRHPVNDFISVGTYTGNGSTSGPSVSCGWRPRIVGMFNAAAAAADDDTTRMMKFVDADSSASDFSGSEKVDVYGYGGTSATWAASFPNEATQDVISSSTDGFQLVTADNGFNRSGETYYYLAFRSLEQVVAPSAIASEEAFGTATVTVGSAGGTQTVTLTAGIASAEAIGSATVTPGAVSVTPSGLASAEALGSATVTPGAVTVSPSGIATAEVLGDATVSPGNVNLAPAGLSSTEAFGTAVVTPGAVDIAPSGLATAEAFGTAVVAAGLSVVPSGIASDEAFGTASISTGAVAVEPSGIASAEALGSATVSPGEVSIAPAGIASAESIGDATVSPGEVSVLPSGIASAEQLGSATVSPGEVVVAPSGIASAESIGTAAVTPGAVEVAPSGIAGAEAFGTAEVTSSVTVEPTGIASAEQLGAPAVTATADIAPTGIGSAEAFGSASVNGGAAEVAPAGIASSEAFGAPTVAAGAAELLPSGIESAEAIGAAILTSIVQLLPGGIGSAEALGSPEVDAGAVTLAPDGIASGEAVGLLALVPGSVTINAEGIATGELFGGPVVSFNVDQLVSGAGGILTAEAFGTGLYVKRRPSSRSTIATVERLGTVEKDAEREFWPENAVRPASDDAGERPDLVIDTVAREGD